MNVFVVASDDDKKIFMKYTELEKVYFLSRPVSLFTFYEKLIEIEKEIEEKRQSGTLYLEEFNNPHTYSESERKKILWFGFMLIWEAKRTDYRRLEQTTTERSKA